MVKKVFLLFFFFSTLGISAQNSSLPPPTGPRIFPGVSFKDMNLKLRQSTAIYREYTTVPPELLFGPSFKSGPSFTTGRNIHRGCANRHPIESLARGGHVGRLTFTKKKKKSNTGSRI